MSLVKGECRRGREEGDNGSSLVRPWFGIRRRELRVCFFFLRNKDKTLVKSPTGNLER